MIRGSTKIYTSYEATEYTDDELRELLLWNSKRFEREMFLYNKMMNIDTFNQITGVTATVKTRIEVIMTEFGAIDDMQEFKQKSIDRIENMVTA